MAEAHVRSSPWSYNISRVVMTVITCVRNSTYSKTPLYNEPIYNEITVLTKNSLRYSYDILANRTRKSIDRRHV